MFKFIRNLFSPKRKVSTPSAPEYSYAHEEKLKHLTQATILEEAKLPYKTMTIIRYINIVLIIAIIWSSIAKVKEIAHTAGEIIPTSFVQTIQHPEGGSISEILIKDGDFVQKGQVIIVLSGENLRGELARAEAKLKSLSEQGTRYREFISLDLRKIEQTQYTNLPLDQQDFLRSMVENRDNQAKVIEEQLKQRNESLKIAMTKLDTVKKNLALARESYQTKAGLLKKGYIPKTAVIDAEKEVNSLQGELTKTYAEIDQNKQGIAEFYSRLESLGSGLKDGAVEKLSNLETDIIETEKVVDKLKDQVSRLEIRSPTDGIIKGLEVKNIGAVVSPGGKIMEIVPVDHELIAEVKISPNDVGNLKSNQDCIIKVSAFDFSRYGSIDGKLMNVSATTFLNKEGASYYRGRVRLLRNHVGKDPTQNVILPGMEVNVDIITGEKTIIGYLLKPIQVALSTAMSER